MKDAPKSSVLCDHVQLIGSAIAVDASKFLKTSFRFASAIS